ncbi:MAG: hypothetical protein QME12_00545 [Nanoarchaeota archaeon]|nr:hypothetical protein [Nanoarchaeota archaeon]
MQVQISFDTEKESLDDLKKLAMAIQDMISKRERQCGMAPSQPAQQQQQSYQPQQFQQTPKPAPKEGKTAGGGRVVPYDDNLSNMMSSLLYSGKKKY